MSIGVRPADVAVEQYLTNFALSFAPKYQDMEAEKLVTAVPVVNTEFKYGNWDIATGYEDVGNDLRADGAASTPYEDKFSQETGALDCYSGHTIVNVKVGNKYPGGLDAYKEVRTQRLTAKAFLRRKIRLATALTYTGMTYKDTPTVKWDASSSTTIFKDIKTAKLAVYNQCGEIPNRIFIPFEVAEALAVSSEFVSRYSGIDAKTQSTDLPPVIEGMETVILKGIKNTANVGQTASLGSVWGDHVRLGFISDAPDPFGMTGMATFRQEGEPMILIREWFDNATQSWIEEYEFNEANIITAQRCWYTLYDCLT